MSQSDSGDKGDAAEPVNVIAALILTLAILFFFYLIRLALLPFVISGVTAFVLSPLADRIARFTHLGRAVAGLLLFLVIAIGVGVLIWLSATPVIDGVKHLITDLQPIIEQMVQRFLGDGPIKILGAQTSAQQIAAEGTTKLRGILEQPNSLILVASAVFGGMFGFFLTMTLLAYFLATGGSLIHGFVRMFPPHWRRRTQTALSRLSPILWRYFFGVGCVVVYAGSAAYIGLGIALHLPHAAILAAMTGLLEIVPVLGPGLSAVLAGIVAVQQSKSAWDIALYAIYATALRLSIDQLVGPLVLGKAARLHPTIVIFCFLAGGLLFGIPGVVLAAPAALALKVVLATVYGELSGDRSRENTTA